MKKQSFENLFYIGALTIILITFLIVVVTKGVAGIIIMTPFVIPAMILNLILIFWTYREKENSEAADICSQYTEKVVVRVISGEKEYSYYLAENEEILVGRDPSKTNVTLSNVKVSRVHCKIKYYRDANRFCVTNYSANGIKVDGRSYKGFGEEVILPRRSIIYLPSDEKIMIE